VVYDYLLRVSRAKGAGFLLLIDPDRIDRNALPALIEDSVEGGVDAFLIGTSLLTTDSSSHVVSATKQVTDIPAVLFPGNSLQVVPDADAILFLSLISGRNPHYLITEQVKGAPLIKSYGIEPISTGYILVESGTHTSVGYISHTQPIPRDKPDIAKVHALAGEYLGMKLIYLEAGSGAAMTVPDEMIADVTGYVSCPVVVGGGIRSPEEAHAKVAAGASFIVVGNRFEKQTSRSLISEFARAVHTRTRTEATYE
jgi:putative glycerol-1-phosphate prenyltransferase